MGGKQQGTDGFKSVVDAHFHLLLIFGPVSLARVLAARRKNNHNTHTLYFQLVIVALRHAVKRRDPAAEAHLDLLLEQGKIVKKITFRGVTISVTVWARRLP